MSWLKQGFDTVEEEGDRRDSDVKVPELFLLVGQEKRVMFLDQAPACVHRHTVRVHGEWTTFTCLGDTGADEVPCCEQLGSKKKQFHGHFTVVDLSPYKDRSGNVHVNDVKLFPAKFKTLKLIQEVMGDQGGLLGKIVKIKRMEPKSPSSGDFVTFVSDGELPDLKFRGKLIKDFKAEDWEKYSNQLVQPKDKKGNPLINYMEVLAPKSAREIKTLLKGYKPTNDWDTGGTNSSNSEDDDTPF